MSDKTEKAKRHLPLLRGFTTRAVEIGEAMLAQPIKINYETDHFGVMGLFFASKELNGMNSVNPLSGMTGPCQCCHRFEHAASDEARVHRVAKVDQEKRALLWRSHTLVDQYYRMCEREAAGTTVDPTEKQQLLDRLEREATAFLTAKAKRAKDDGRPLPEHPYRRDWTGQNPYELFDDVRAKQLYQRIYSPLPNRATPQRAASLKRSA